VGAAGEFEPTLGVVHFGERTTGSAQRVVERVFESLAGDGVLVALEGCEFAGGHDLPAEASRARSEIDDVIGALHGLVIVFDDEEGVALVAEGVEGVEKGLIVPWVESDGGFVEHVEDATQVGAKLGGETNTLCFAAGQRFG